MWWFRVEPRFVLLRKTQDSWERISFNRESVYSWEVLFGKIAKNVAGRHLNKEIAAQLSGNGGGIVSVDTARHLVREVAREELRRPHSSRDDDADVSELWL